MKLKNVRQLVYTGCMTTLLTFSLCFSQALTADAADAGGPPAPLGAPSTAAYYIKDGQRVAENELTDGFTLADGTVSQEADGTWNFSNLYLTSGLYSFSGIVATGSNSKVILDNSTIKLGVNQAVSSDASTGSTAISVDDGATMFINKSTLQVAGSQRYTTSNYGTGTLVVNDSTIESEGSVENTSEIALPFSNAALLISGEARSNFSIGASDTYYFNSNCIADGWAALSTDSSTGDGLDLYAYNTTAIAENGGYGAYADFGCRVWLYGSNLKSAEIGAIIAKSGAFHIYDGAKATSELLAYKSTEGATTTAGTTITGGRNAIMMHAPDMMGQGLAAVDCGTLEVINSTLATSKDLVSTFDYATAYGQAISDYINYSSGAAILVKSTSADITLDNAKIDSYSNVILQTVLNSDSMGNFLEDGDALNESVKPISLVMKNMTEEGNILHMDYQRKMDVSLENSTWSGQIISGTMADWNALWSSYEGTDINWVVDKEWTNYYGASLNLKSNSIWNVTGESSLTSLIIETGSKINGIVTIDGKEVTVTPGTTYVGKVVVKPLAATANTTTATTTATKSTTMTVAKTGDTTSVAWLVSLTCLSITGIAGLTLRKRAFSK